MKLITTLLICVPLFAATPPKTSSPAKKPDIVATISSTEMSRNLVYNEREIPTVHTKLHYTTVFVLPKSEKIMDVLVGNDEEWTRKAPGGDNFAYLEPEKAGARTNLNLVTASGNVYTFIVSEDSEIAPDLKVFVTTKEASLLSAMGAAPKWVTAVEMDAALKTARNEVQAANKDADAARADAADKISTAELKAQAELSAFRSGFPSSLQHDYVFHDKHNRFHIQAMAHSKDFTYIWAAPSETPALYEKKDGKPSLINFTYENGVYVVNKVVDAGYLTVGKQKLEFKRDGE